MKLFLALISLVLMTGCGNKNQSNGNTANSNLPKMYVYGDSIDKGYVSMPFATQIGLYLNKVVINKSVGSTSMFYDNQYPMIMRDPTDADTVIFDPGLNDASYYGSDPVYIAQYTSALREILNHWSFHHVNVYMITTMTTVPGQSNAKNSDANIYAQITRDLVKEVNDPRIKVIDFNQMWVPTFSNTLDGVHPNQAGNDWLTQMFVRNL